MNQNVNVNTKLFSNELTKMNGGKMESCIKKKDGNRKLAMEEDEMQRI